MCAALFRTRSAHFGFSNVNSELLKFCTEKSGNTRYESARMFESKLETAMEYIAGCNHGGDAAFEFIIFSRRVEVIKMRQVKTTRRFTCDVTECRYAIKCVLLLYGMYIGSFCLRIVL